MSRMILLADDSITIQKIVNLTFSGEGIDVVTVGNGDSALKKIHEHRPSLVLADIFMPGKNGYEVCEAIKTDPELRSIPVILLVGAFEPFDGHEAARVKADSHLTKPFEIKALISAVRNLIEIAEQQATVVAEPASRDAFVEEEEKRPWAARMKELLLGAKEVVAKAKAADLDQLSVSELARYENEYDQIIKSGLEEEPEVLIVHEKKRGRIKQSKSKNLLDRFQQRKADILRFMHNFQVPFDNNLAERDLRMMKLKQKISGCFRGKGGDYFCRIRGYISTLKKNGQNVIQGLQNVFIQKPTMCQFDTPE